MPARADGGGRGARLLDGDALAHGVEDALRAALDAEAEGRAAGPAHQRHQRRIDVVDARVGQPGEVQPAAEDRLAQRADAVVLAQEVVVVEVDDVGAQCGDLRELVGHRLDVAHPVGQEARAHLDRRAERAGVRAAARRQHVGAAQARRGAAPGRRPRSRRPAARRAAVAAGRRCRRSALPAPPCRGRIGPRSDPTRCPRRCAAAEGLGDVGDPPFVLAAQHAGDGFLARESPPRTLPRADRPR